MKYKYLFTIHRDENFENDPFKRRRVAENPKLVSECSSFPNLNADRSWVLNASDARLIKGKLSSGPEYMRCESSQTFFDVIGRLASRQSYNSVIPQKQKLPPIDVGETHPQELVISRMSFYGEQIEDEKTPKIFVANEHGTSIPAKESRKRLLSEGKAHISIVRIRNINPFFCKKGTIHIQDRIKFGISRHPTTQSLSTLS